MTTKEFCEWTEEETPGMYHPNCDKEFAFTGDNHLCYPYCPKCGRQIKVTDELKPLPLMGIEPVVRDNGDGRFIVMYTAYDPVHTFVVMKKIDIYGATGREAIESWNSLVGKLKGVIG